MYRNLTYCSLELIIEHPKRKKRKPNKHKTKSKPKYRTGALLGACAYTYTGKKYALIREMRLIKSAFFNAGILRTAAKYALNSEYAPTSTVNQ